MTKKLKEAYDRYLKSDMYSLSDAYGSCSAKKRTAWETCRRFCEERGGENLKIIGANTHFFSVGFVYTDEGVRKFVYITHAGTHVGKLEDAVG